MPALGVQLRKSPSNSQFDVAIDAYVVATRQAWPRQAYSYDSNRPGLSLGAKQICRLERMLTRTGHRSAAVNPWLLDVPARLAARLKPVRGDG